MINNTSEIQNLQNRVRELERQLSAAQGTIHALQESKARASNAYADELREMMRLLELDRARLSAVLQQLPVGVWISDEQGRLISKNQQADRIWAGEAPLLNSIDEYTRYETRYAENGVLLQPEEYPMARALHTGEPVEPVELIIRRFDGSEGTVLVSAAPFRDNQDRLTGAVAVNVDFTERKQAEKELEASRNRINDILKSLRDGLFALDRGWSIIYINEQAAQIAGFPAWELTGRTLWELWPQLLGTPLERLYRQAMEAGIPGQSRVKGIETGRWYDINVYPSSEGITVFYVDKTEQILAEERFNRAFHASPNALVISRQQDGRIENVNEMFVTFFGYTREEVIGKTSTELNMFKNPAERQESIQKLQSDGFVRDFELDVRLRSGEIRSVSLSVEPIRIGEENMMLTTIQDITERKQIEAALRKRESILAQAGEMAHLGAWDIELGDQNDVNANPLNWSNEVYRIFGYTPGEVEPSNELFFERVHPDDRALVQKGVSRAIEMRKPYAIEHRVRRPDGEERIVQEHAEVFFDEAGKAIRIVGAVQDITERKRAEQALRESEERFHSLADSMPQLVWTAAPDGTVDYYNQRYREYQEIKQDAGGSWEWSLVLHPDDLEPTVRAWQHAVRTGEVYQMEHRVRMIDGSFRWHLSRGVPVFDEQGRLRRWFGTATDIHEQKLAQEKLQDYAGRLEASNRELEQFAFMASHDLQEPLRKIQMFGDLLLERGGCLEDREREYIERMRKSAGRMRDMVNGLLQLSRVTTQARPHEAVDLAKVTADVLSDLDDQIRRTRGKVELGALPTVPGDPQQLHQLMQNLIGNALKYHRPGVPPVVKISAEESGDQVQIIVEDQGIGFEPGEAERILQPFQRLVSRTEYEGSGIGLAICRRIVERHHGKITSQGQPGQGATFIVTLPGYRPEHE